METSNTVLTPEAIAAAIEGRGKGQYYSLVMRRPGKLRKSAGDMNIVKESRVTGQLADYSHRSSVRTAVEEGERDAPELPGYVERVSYIGNVKFWHGRNGKTYLPVTVAQSHTAQWYWNDAPVEIATIAEYLLASETAERESKAEIEEKGQAQFFAVSLDNIASIR